MMNDKKHLNCTIKYGVMNLYNTTLTVRQKIPFIRQIKKKRMNCSPK